MPGFGDVRLGALQPLSTVTGAVELIAELAHWLVTMTGMSAVAMSPKAGAHGELCGMMAIKAAHQAAGREPEDRPGAGIGPGTNPATAALLGYKVVSIGGARGRHGGSGGQSAHQGA